jgi:hypothetical protein
MRCAFCVGVRNIEPDSGGFWSGRFRAGMAPRMNPGVNVEHRLEIRRAAVVEVGRGPGDPAELEGLEALPVIRICR